MKIQFDGRQTYQLEAISAVADLFEGMEHARESFIPQEIQSSASATAKPTLQLIESVFGNSLVLSDADLLKNVRKVQQRNRIEIGDVQRPLESWKIPPTEGF